MPSIDDEPEIYIGGDQPTTCPACGRRTEFEEAESGVQHHTCLNCGKRFDVVFEEEISDDEVECLLLVEAAIERLQQAEDMLLNVGAFQAATSVTNALRSANRAARVTRRRLD